MDLNGRWLASVSTDELRLSAADPRFDDSAWASVQVPGHWRSNPGLAASDGPVLYRRSFEAPKPASGRRTFLTFDGIFYQGDVWLDGEYLGPTEGYFAPHTFEVSEQFERRQDHALTVEVACARPSELRSKRNLTGVFQHWDCIDPEWNPGGIWAPVHLRETGPVAITHLKVLCREANAERGVLDLEAVLDVREPCEILLRTVVSPQSVSRPETEAPNGPAAAAATEETAAAATEENEDHVLAAGQNVVRWRLAIERPSLWWPKALGDQPLYEVLVEVRGSEVDTDPPSDARQIITGIREVKVRNFVATVNGERLFLKGVNCGPTRAAIADATGDELVRDVELASSAGLDLIRVHAHISRPELYDAADRMGLLVWQDLPLQWGYGQVRRQAISQARDAVTLLGHHPSIALWCGHNEPMAVGSTVGKAPMPKTIARFAAAQVLPSWNKTALDRSIRRALERADPSRAVVAHSGVLPHPTWGTDSHLYFGWYLGDERDLSTTLARFPVLGRFVSEFGAQSVPDSAGFMHPEQWPHLDWEHLEARHCYQRAIFDQRVTPASFASFDAWRRASQEYQASLLRHQIETLRRLKYRPTGGFCVFLLADAQPAVSWSIIDHERVPKAAYRQVAESCATVIVTSDRPQSSYRPGQRFEVDLHAVSDLRTAVDEVEAKAVLRWPGGERSWTFHGEIPADSCARIGHVMHLLPDDVADGEISLDLRMSWADGSTKNRYTSRVVTGG